MILVGNDIVDTSTQHARHTWSNRRWASKVFTSEEQEVIYSSSKPMQKFWISWAMKESAYKVLQKAGVDSFFNFKKIKIDYKQNACIFNEWTLPMKIEIKEELVHVSTQTTQATNVLHNILPVEKFDLSEIEAKANNVLPIDCQITHHYNGAPSLNSKISDISFSYDGKWASYYLAIANKPSKN